MSPRPVTRARVLQSSTPRKRRAPDEGTSDRMPLGLARPFLKWVGSKRQLLQAYQAFYPVLGSKATYHEPFLGSGAVFFSLLHLRPGLRASLADDNAELVACWEAIRDDVEAVIAALEVHRDSHEKDHYYKTRQSKPKSPGARAARFIYLNKTGFNGLYRVNSKGEFNVPFGDHRSPLILDEQNLRAVQAVLEHVDLRVAPFASVLDRAKRGDFVYLDPPYDPTSKTAYFTAYTRGLFGRDQQAALADVYRELDRRGCKVMLSNSSTPFVRDLYKSFDIHEVHARRAVNSKADGRGPVKEVVVLNYTPGTTRELAAAEAPDVPYGAGPS